MESGQPQTMESEPGAADPVTSDSSIWKVNCFSRLSSENFLLFGLKWWMTGKRKEAVLRIQIVLTGGLSNKVFRVVGEIRCAIIEDHLWEPQWWIYVVSSCFNLNQSLCNMELCCDKQLYQVPGNVLFSKDVDRRKGEVSTHRCVISSVMGRVLCSVSAHSSVSWKICLWHHQ